MRSSILIIYTGGTIGMKTDAETGALLAERAEPIGLASNNVAEYSGLIAGLEAALAIDPAADILVRMDSKLVVEQMSGRWKIKHPDMQELARQAKALIAGRHVRGAEPDAAAGSAGTGHAPAVGPAHPHPRAVTPPSPASPRPRPSGLRTR